jgi:hypothetical protein
LNQAWLRAEGITCLEPIAKPITMPRGFRRMERRRRRWREPQAIIRDVSVRSAGGLSIVTGTGAATAALAGALVGVVRPHAGIVDTSHRPVAVLRARARLVVDLHVRGAVLRELRLRGIPASFGSDIVDEACRIAEVDPREWASDLERHEFARLAPAAIVCSDAPIVILDSVFAGQSPEFDDALLRRLAERSRRLDLVTILCAAERRGVDELVELLEVQQIQSLPREHSDSPRVARVDVDDQEEDDVEDEDDVDDRDPNDLPEFVPPARNLVTFDEVRFTQFGDEVDTIDGRAPFTIRIAFTTHLDGPMHWSLRLVHRTANVVLAAADGTSEERTDAREAVVDVPGGISSGKLALHARVEGSARGHRHLVVQPTVALVPVMTADDDASGAVATGELTFAP